MGRSSAQRAAQPLRRQRFERGHRGDVADHRRPDEHVQIERIDPMTIRYEVQRSIYVGAGVSPHRQPSCRAAFHVMAGDDDGLEARMIGARKRGHTLMHGVGQVDDRCQPFLRGGGRRSVDVEPLGLDTPSPDDPRQGQGSDLDSPNHKTLLAAGVVLLEYLSNLELLPPTEVYLVALPLPVRDADGAPTRVVALQSRP